MWRERNYIAGGLTKFFYLGLVHNSLSNYYQLNFSLMHHHKYSLSELENMIPFERDIYVTLLKQHLEEEEERRKNQK